MATRRDVILRIDFDNSNAIQQQVALKKEIDALNKEKKKLTESIKANGGATEKERVELEILNVKIAENKRETREVGKAIQDTLKFRQAEAGSIEANRAKLSQLTAEYIKAKNPTKEQTQQIKALSDRLKEQESAIGDNRRTVGAYEDAINKAASSNGLLGKAINTFKEAQNAATTALNVSRASIIGNVNALKLMRAALISTGIGAIVVALGSLIAFLTKTQEGVDFVSTKMKGLTTVIGVVTDKFSAVGEVIFKAFENPKQAILDLVDLIKTNLINRLKAFQVIFQGIADLDFKKANDGFIQLATGVTDATDKFSKFTSELNEARKAGEAIEKESIRIRDAEIALNVERAKSRARIKELNKLGEDTTKSLSERRKALQEASDIEIALQNKQLKLQEDRVANIRAEQALTNNLTADNQKLADEEIKLAGIRAESQELQTRLQNKLNTIIQQGAAISAKAEADRKKAAEDAIKLREEQVKAFEDLSKQELANTLKQSDIEFQQRQAQLKEQFAQQLITQEQFAEQSNMLRAEQLQTQLSDLRDYAETVPEVQEQLALKEIEISNLKTDTIIANNEKQKNNEQILLDFERDIANTKLDLTQTLIGGVADLLAKDEANRERFAVAIKAISIAEVAINLQKELSAIAANAAANPANALTFGAAGVTQSSLLSGIAIAKAAFATTQIAMQKFEDGGMAIDVGGKPHTAGGTKYFGEDGNAFEVEAGEKMFVLKKNASDYINKLSSLNQIFGGRSWTSTGTRYAADGGAIADGGFTQRSISSSVNDMIQQQNLLKMLPTPVVRVTEIERVNNERNTAIIVSSL